MLRTLIAALTVARTARTLRRRVYDDEQREFDRGLRDAAGPGITCLPDRHQPITLLPDLVACGACGTVL